MMNERLEFASLLEEDVCGMSKAEWREKLAADTEQFLADGGEIEQLPYNWQAEIAARVGYWQSLGQTEMDEMLDAIETKVY